MCELKKQPPKLGEGQSWRPPLFATITQFPIGISPRSCSSRCTDNFSTRSLTSHLHLHNNYLLFIAYYSLFALIDMFTYNIDVCSSVFVALCGDKGLHSDKEFVLLIAIILIARDPKVHLKSLPWQFPQDQSHLFMNFKEFLRKLNTFWCFLLLSSTHLFLSQRIIKNYQQ